MDNNKLKKFTGVIIRKIYEADNYRAYAIAVDKEKYPFIKNTKYGNAVINGDLTVLDEGMEYNVTAEEIVSKNGYSYKVHNIQATMIDSKEDMYAFLKEVLTENQANTLYEVYSNIVEKVMKNDLDDIDLNKLNGIKEYTFNIIKNKIIENYCLADLVIKYQNLITFNVLRKLYDNYTSIEKVEEALLVDGYKALCDLNGIGFTKADGILLKLEENGILKFKEPLKTSMQRCKSCVIYMLKENENNGHTRMDLIELKQKVSKLCPACMDKFVECIKDENIFKIVMPLKAIGLLKTYTKEKYIADRIKFALNNPIKWNFDVNKYKDVDGYSLTEEQMEILKLVNSQNVCILQGWAGSGKSASTQAIINMLKDNNKSFKLFAPTGKASKVLAEYTKESASTIHRGLGYNPKLGWTVNQENPLMCEVVIVDEFSMVDINLFTRLLDGIDFTRTKLVMIADVAQIPSISSGNIIQDFLNIGQIPTATLTKIFRYGEGGLMTVATDTRNSKIYLKDINSKLTKFGNGDYIFVNVEDSSISTNMIALYEKLLNMGYSVEDVQVLSAYRKGEYGTIVFNKALQKICNKNYGTFKNLSIGDNTFYVDDLVMQIVNNYEATVNNSGNTVFIANGETGRIKDIIGNNVVIDFDGVEILYNRQEMSMVELAYAVTIFKVQGSSVKVPILITPASHTYFLNSNLIYVGLTRMKEKCYHIGNVKTVNTCIKKKENLERKTFLHYIYFND